jgi:hypothetical protein
MCLLKKSVTLKKNIMQKRIFILLFLLFALYFKNFTFGQLNGIYTIGNAPSDYQTFTAALNDLHSQGIISSVVFEIKPGTYTEQISINPITGANATNTITFQPQDNNVSSVTLQFSSSASAANNYVIKLDGADFINFDKLTIIRTDTFLYSRVIEISGSARKNSFTNNIIEGNTNQNTKIVASVIGTDSSGSKSYNTFNNNIIRYGSHGLFYVGQSNTIPDSCVIVSNNQFIGQFAKGLRMKYQRFLNISNNEITSNVINNNYNAMYFQYSNDTMRIVNNKIAIATGYGINMWNCNETVVVNALIANNFISIISNQTSINAIGIYIFNSKYQHILHNSINVQNGTPINSSCINLNGSSTASLYIKNNIFKNSGGGYAYYVSKTTSTPIAASNYNDLFVGTGNYIGYWQYSENISPPLTNWQNVSSFDQNSFTTNPNYISSTDLHVTSTVLNGAATNNLSPFVISTDIDGDIRNATTPDVGADEFHINDLGIDSVLMPASGVYCQNTEFNVKVRIKNYGYNNYNGAISVYYRIAEGTQVNETTPSLSIPAGGTQEYTFSNTETPDTTGQFVFIAGTNITEDNNRANDTSSNIIPILKLPVAGFTYEINELEATFTNTSENAILYLWNFGDGSANSNAANPVHTFPAYGNYNIMLVASNACSSDIENQSIGIVGIIENSSTELIAVSPIPADDYIIIDITQETELVKSVSIMDINGKLICSRSLLNNSSKQYKLSVSDFTEGMYFLIMNFENKIVCKKILIHRN